MRKIVPIVEGPGEVQALPGLLRRLLWSNNRYDIEIAKPKNADGLSNLTVSGGIERFVLRAQIEPACAGIIVVVDADKNCPVAMARELTARIAAIGPRATVVVCVATCEYEAWFLASLPSIAGRDINGRPGLPEDLTYPGVPESLVGVKGWLTRNFPEGRSYKPSEDQAAMTAHLDFDLAAQCRSFRRLQHAVEEAVAAIDSGTVIVTPQL